MTDKEKAAASVPSVGADGKQPLTKSNKKSIADLPGQGNLQSVNNDNLQAISMTENFQNNTIRSFVKNLNKPKNLFMYYPYEYRGVSEYMMRGLESQTTDIFKNVLDYRDELKLYKDTFVCFKINDFFAILEWVNKHFILRERVSELLCTNYRDAKTYSVY